MHLYIQYIHKHIIDTHIPITVTVAVFFVPSLRSTQVNVPPSESWSPLMPSTHSPRGETFTLYLPPYVSRILLFKYNIWLLPDSSTLDHIMLLQDLWWTMHFSCTLVPFCLPTLSGPLTILAAANTIITHFHFYYLVNYSSDVAFTVDFLTIQTFRVENI